MQTLPSLVVRTLAPIQGEKGAHLSFLRPLISTGLQPGVRQGNRPSRFNGLTGARMGDGPMKRLKPFHSFRPIITRLKPGANERNLFPTFPCKKLECACEKAGRRARGNFH